MTCLSLSFVAVITHWFNALISVCVSSLANYNHFPTLMHATTGFSYAQPFLLKTSIQFRLSSDLFDGNWISTPQNVQPLTQQVPWLRLSSLNSDEDWMLTILYELKQWHCRADTPKIVHKIITYSDKLRRDVSNHINSICLTASTMHFGCLQETYNLPLAVSI